jgi:pimeloyl-ACP methyl ester carboxylesterase
LEYELDSPVWRHLILGMASRHKFIRYDGRGTGLSERDAVDISMDRWVSDLECIVDSLSLERFILLGVSQEERFRSSMPLASPTGYRI